MQYYTSAKGSVVLRRYTRHELDNMEIPALKAICAEAKIKPESISSFNDKQAMINLIYKFLGAVTEPYIKTWDQERIERLNKIVFSDGSINKNIAIDTPAYLHIYKGVDSLNDKSGGYKALTEVDINYTNALLVDQNDEIQGIFDVSSTPVKNSFSLGLRAEMLNDSVDCGSHNGYSIIFFPDDFNKILSLYNSANVITSPVIYVRKRLQEVTISDVQETDEALVIDYGTSYTTAGTYDGDIIKLIQFPSNEPCERDPSVASKFAECKGCGRCALCPSAVAVKECAGGQASYLFGHEARDRIPMARNSIFYDTKRWVNSYKEDIDVKDIDGKSATVSRAEIIKSFLLYIIHTAEMQNKTRYKTICFTSPVKQRALSIKMYAEVLSGYNIVANEFIDEAVAVVYESITQKVENLEYSSGEKKSVLLIDCGGGTSDMVRCDYTIHNRGKRSDIEVVAGYANGDTNFGGNNLTYRVMQYIKIKLADYYRKTQPRGIDFLLDSASLDIYDAVDTIGINKLYETFESAYKEAGKLIPTDYTKYMNDAESTYLNVRGNFHYLWGLAERVKVDLYNNVGNFEFDFEKLKTADNKSVFMIAVKNARGDFTMHMECPLLRVSRDEIGLLLKPEIYNLIKKFIQPYYDEDIMLSDINEIKLSGQTTRIDIFRDVLKEYIAGHKARMPFERGYAKKLKCVNGAIAYHGAKSIGRIKPHIKYEPAKIPYYLTVETFDEMKEARLISLGQFLTDIYAYVDRTIETRYIVFNLKDHEMRLLQQIRVKLDFMKYGKTNYSELLEKFVKFKQDDIDQILDDEARVFVYSDDESWGFKWVGIARNSGVLVCGDEQFIPFESSGWEMNFFDGLK